MLSWLHFPRPELAWGWLCLVAVLAAWRYFLPKYKYEALFREKAQEKIPQIAFPWQFLTPAGIIGLLAALAAICGIIQMQFTPELFPSIVGLGADFFFWLNDISTGVTVLEFSFLWCSIVIVFALYAIPPLVSVLQCLILRKLAPGYLAVICSNHLPSDFATRFKEQHSGLTRADLKQLRLKLLDADKLYALELRRWIGSLFNYLFVAGLALYLVSRMLCFYSFSAAGFDYGRANNAKSFSQEDILSATFDFSAPKAVDGQAEPRVDVILKAVALGDLNVNAADDLIINSKTTFLFIDWLEKSSLPIFANRPSAEFVSMLDMPQRNASRQYELQTIKKLVAWTREQIQYGKVQEILTKPEIVATPSATPTPTVTATPTAQETETPTMAAPTALGPSSSPTATNTPTKTTVATQTAALYTPTSPQATASPTATDRPTLAPLASETSETAGPTVPQPTASPMASDTPSPSLNALETATPLATETYSAAASSSLTETAIASPTETNSATAFSPAPQEPTASELASSTPSVEEKAAETAVPQETQVYTPSLQAAELATESPAGAEIIETPDASPAAQPSAAATINPNYTLGVKAPYFCSPRAILKCNPKHCRCFGKKKRKP